MFGRDSFIHWLACVLATALLAAPLAAEPYRFKDVERIVAVSDVHGAYQELLGVLAGTELINDELHWQGGAAHLVVVGNLIGRGDQGRQALDLLMRLEIEAAAAGGAVHVLMGAHEARSLTGELSEVSTAAFSQYGSATAGDRPAGYSERLQAFTPDGVYGAWLLQRPVMIVIDDTAFVHGGLSARLEGQTLESINASFQQALRQFATGWHELMAAGLIEADADFATIEAGTRALADGTHDSDAMTAAQAMVTALDSLVFDPDGPLHYRGTAKCHPYTETQRLAGILDALGAARVVIGHTPTLDRRISQRLGGHAIRISTGMNQAAFNGRPAALVIEHGNTVTWYPDEGELALVDELNRTWARPYGMSDEEIEQFLRTAEVVLVEDLSIGITRPRRLTLEQDGHRMRAIFKTKDNRPHLQRRTWDRRTEDADRFVFDVAAYRLDRLLDLHMVPITVLRTIDGEPGAVQYWVENAFNENQRQERGLNFSGPCPLVDQYKLMWLFDGLIYNEDRNLGNLLYDEHWMLWLIDHTRAFRARPEVPFNIRRRQLRPGPELSAALARLSESELEVLRPYLNRRQIQDLLTRAEHLQRR